MRRDWLMVVSGLMFGCGPSSGSADASGTDESSTSTSSATASTTSSSSDTGTTSTSTTTAETGSSETGEPENPGPTESFVIVGTNEGDRTGWSVDLVGDVDGDGLEDLLVGEPGPQGFYGFEEGGRAFVVLGKTDLDPVALADVGQGNGGFAIGDSAPFDALGSSVSAAGDVNGDGLADLLLGSATSPGSDTVRIYVVFGKIDNANVDIAEIEQGNGGFVVESDVMLHPWSRASRGLGDVNGDGLDDFGFGWQNSDAGGMNSGAVYVVFGKADTQAVALADIEAGQGGFSLIGENPGDHLGDTISAGDVNGDGLVDVVTGAYGYADDNAGRAYVVFGTQNPTSVSLSQVAAGMGGFAIDGQDSFGKNLAVVGDINGDGMEDIGVGVTGYAQLDGRGYVIFGKSTTELVDAVDVVAGVGGFVMEAEDAEGLFGISINRAGDVTGDGLDDLIVGAYKVYAEPNVRGRAYVVFGRTSTTPVDMVDVAQNFGGFAISATGNDLLGRTVGGGGDVNGDGLPDVIVGAEEGQHRDPDTYGFGGLTHVVMGFPFP